jgi:GT2 family glycosyltransferase
MPENAYIRNLYEDDRCSVPVVNPVKQRNVPGSSVDTPLRTGSYYGWMHSDHANIRVKSASFDANTRRFCLEFPLWVNGDSLEALRSIPQCCIKSRVFMLSDLTTALQSDDTVNCLKNLHGRPSNACSPPDDDDD